MSTGTRMADDSLKTEVAARIDPVCQQFEAAWQRGERPNIDDFLGRANVADREALRAELERIERAYRQRQFRTVDGRGLLPTTVGLPPGEAPDTVRQTTSGRLFEGRYEVIEEVGRGGMGTVVRAHDGKLGRQVALKMLLPACRRALFSTALQSAKAPSRAVI